MKSEKWFGGSLFDDSAFGTNPFGVNSGVFDKAFYLVTDGDTFNGYTIRGLGLAKAAKIIWTMQNLLPSGADYKDVFSAMPLACRKNIGRAGTHITESDCRQVDKAVRATEMDKEPRVGAPKDVGFCPTGKTVKVIYGNGFESKSGWTFQRGWQLSSEGGYPYAAVGHESAYGWPTAGDDITLTQKSGMRLASGAYLRFDHAYWLQPNDGARVEYDTGSGWKVASALPNVNGEDTPAGEFNGQKSFGGESNGFGGTRYDLSSLAGKTVKLRFHMKKVDGDPETAEESDWYVDNLKIYTCI